jgi:hypothetical protein
MVNIDTNSAKMLSETDIIKILEFLIDNIIAMSDGRVFQQSHGNKLPSSRRLASLFVCGRFHARASRKPKGS